MKRILISIIFLCLSFLLSGSLQAACPFDHLVIGCNPDNEPNTLDDNVLIIDTTDLYRRSDPNNRDQHTWLHWHYPLFPFGDKHYIAEPGFGQFHHPDEAGVFQFEDPNRCLVGVKDVDYRIMVECLDISPDFEAYISLGGDPVLTSPNDAFNHSNVSGSTGHMHLYYLAPDTQPHWITFRVYDAFYNPGPPETGYCPSEPITVVFGSQPIPGDIYVDGSVNLLDLEKLAFFWLSLPESTEYNTYGQAKIDMFDRADINRDYGVNFLDFSMLAQNWLSPQ